jgi:hypothetical protein
MSYDVVRLRSELRKEHHDGLEPDLTRSRYGMGFILGTTIWSGEMSEAATV